MTRQSLPDPEVAPVPLGRIVSVLTAGWAVALAVLLALPAGHAGERWWWPWTAVFGLTLGVVGLAVVRRQSAAESAQSAGASAANPPDARPVRE